MLSAPSSQASENHPTRRALVIGLDGATFDLIQPLIDAGKLPNLAAMAAEGTKSKLRSTMLPLSPPAWTSFLTGKNPGSHGVYDFARRVEGTYEFRPTSSLDRKHKTIWEVVGENGGSSIVVNVPLTYPPTPIRGAMITGFPTPTERGDYTYPADLLSRLRSEFGNAIKLSLFSLPQTAGHNHPLLFPLPDPRKESTNHNCL